MSRISRSMRVLSQRSRAHQALSVVFPVKSGDLQGRGLPLKAFESPGASLCKCLGLDSHNKEE